MFKNKSNKLQNEFKAMIYFFRKQQKASLHFAERLLEFWA